MAKKTAKRVAKKAVVKTPAKRTSAKKAVVAPESETPDPVVGSAEGGPDGDVAKALTKGPAKRAAAKKSTVKKTVAKKTAAKKTTAAKATFQAAESGETPELPDEPTAEPTSGEAVEATPVAAVPVLFQAPAEVKPKRATKKTTRKAAPAETPAEPDEAADEATSEATDRPVEVTAAEPGDTPAEPGDTPAGVAEPGEELRADTEPADDSESAEDAGEGAGRRRRRRGGRRRRKGSGSTDGDSGDESADGGEAETADADSSESGESASSRRRRRRRRAGEEGDAAPDDPANTVTRVRAARTAEDEIAGFTGSTRLEAKKQRRREGREAGRRRAPIISEAEFLARRESVERVMVIRQHEDLTQIAVLEDKVLVEHYVSRETQTSLIGNVYLGRVQNVLPSMEAAFIDIGKGRNAVLYAGEVNWDALGAKDGSQRKIESVLKSGQTVLVQVTKDPIGHKGARLTSQISLPGRFLVYVPEGNTSGISRKLPDTERNRLKTLLKQIVPDGAGVIVRTAAEGASEDELTRDVERLKARWEDIEKKVEAGSAPQLLYGEPDLTLKVVRDLFTEDFAKLVISGDDAWETVSQYVEHVAPDLADRMERHDGEDAFTTYRIHEQIAKGLDRKVW
ncbi:MAG: ribonuclease E/G, partial [Nocardioidaceae bacterium]